MKAVIKKLPMIIVASTNGKIGINEAMAVLKSGGSALDAVDGLLYIGIDILHTEADTVAALSQAAVAALVLLAELGSLGLKHLSIPPDSGAGRFGLGGLRLFGPLDDLALEDPDLDPDDPVGGACLGEPVIDVSAQRVKGNPAFPIPFCPCNFSTS